MASAADRVGPAVCAVSIGGRGLGSGVVISQDGLIVTNAHVVADSTSVDLGFPEARRLSGRIIGIDPDTDLALIKAAGDGLSTANLGDSSRLRLSDLLVYRAGDLPASSLDSALARAVPGDTVTRDHAIGLFWETYGMANEGESVDLSLSVERVDHGWIRSARQRLRLTPVDTPLRIRWTDARPSADNAAAHAVSLDLANLDAGRYRVMLTLTSLDGVPVTTTREISLIDR